MQACRDAIDSHRAFNEARITAISSSSTIQAAKQSLWNATVGGIKTGKGGVIILPPPEPNWSIYSSTQVSQDEIKDALEDDRTQATVDMYQVFADNGFVDENGNGSLFVFKEWHDSMVLTICKACYPGEGTCDWCGQTAFIDQPCLSAPDVISAISELNCRHTEIMNGTWEIDDMVYLIGMSRIKSQDPALTEVIDGIVRPISICPEGHGFHILQDEVTEPPIDLFFWTGF